MKIKRSTLPGNVVMEIADRDAERLSKSGATPFRLKKILVPVDFSACSKKALQYAVPFAEQFNAKLIFLHVLTIHYVTGWELAADTVVPIVGDASQKEMKARLAALAQEAGAEKATDRFEVRQGAAAAEIINAAKEFDVDLIIMSTHGHTGRVHAFIGSVASDVTRLSPCPVLVVREHERDFIPCAGNPFKTNHALPHVTSTS